MQLAVQRLSRFTSLGLSLGQKEDLDASNTHLTEAILSYSHFPDAPGFQPPRHWPVTMLFMLARNLVLRHTVFRQPEDIIASVKFLRYLRDNFHPIEAFQLGTVEFISTFVQALAHHVIVKTGDNDLESEHMKEMTALLRDLGTSDFSKSYPSVAVHSLCSAVISIYLWADTKEPPDQLIEVLREVMMHNPNLEHAFLALAVCLTNRFCMSYDLDDYEEAISLVDKFFASHPIGNSVAPTQEKALSLLIWLLDARLSRSVKPEYLEDAISRLRALLCIPSLPSSSHAAITGSLDRYVQKRCDYFGVTGNSVKTLPNSSSVVTGSSSLPILIAHQPTVELANDTIAQSHEKKRHLTELLTAIHNNKNADVKEIVKLGRTLLPLPHSTYRFSYLLHHRFVEILFQAYLRTNILDYVNEAISIYRDMCKDCGEKLGRTLATHGLTLLLSQRWKALHHQQDLDELMLLYSLTVDDVHWQAYQRLEISCSWAVAARVGAHPSTSVAYEKAMSLLQDTLVFSPTLQTQHFHLGALRKTGWMPLDYASYQIEKDQLKSAIETLERGRSLLWSQMRGLRTSTDQLRKVVPAIADKFADMNRILETVATTVADSMNKAVDNRAAGGSEGLDQFGNLLMQQRKLLEMRRSLISLIQTLPGFENFLKPPSFDFLASAAALGPVILINQSRWRSDIVILLKDLPPSLISTPPDFHVRANRLNEQLLSVRKAKGLDSNEYDLTLASVLADLYDLVGKPVLERLRKLEVPKKSRIWWCPTSAFCSLPLHAMGPIPSYDHKKVYFMDLYIPSYTQSLTALIDSRKPGSQPQTFDKPSLLLVAQPETLPGALGEINVIEALVSPVKALVSQMATPVTVIEGLRDHRFAHFISHGLLETGKPFDASFELHGGSRLTLLEIVRSHLPIAELTFLSACHTAELTDESIADEGLHLAAAVQYCGFRSVVGTMWAMADTDGEDLSKQFYKSVFSDSARWRGVPYYERSAKGLRDAVKKLRRKRGITLERWVNFDHYGA